MVNYIKNLISDLSLPSDPADIDNIAFVKEDGSIKINQEIKGIRGDEGGYNPRHLWKLKKKLSPKHNEPPVTMKDAEGNILTNWPMKSRSLQALQKILWR